MYKGKLIGVSVPSYNEEKLVGRVITTMPEFVDRIIVVDDCSRDNTAQVAQALQQQTGERLILIRHETNQGVGGAVLSGHRRGFQEGMDVMVVMAGDAQMSPDDLPAILDPVVEGRADYAKGNRFFNREAWTKMPRLRFFGNAGLSMLTKIVSGYWHVSDPQSGYTALSRQAFERLDLGNIRRGYHFENDMLIHMNVASLRVVDVPIQAVYGVGEKSGIRHLWAVFSFSWYLAGRFFWRLVEKYVIRDFHPLVFFYLFGILLAPLGFLFGAYLVLYRLISGLPVQATSALFAVLLFISGMQFLLFAMGFDKDYNRP